jgi:hypothetical protein
LPGSPRVAAVGFFAAAAIFSNEEKEYIFDSA